MTPKFMAYYVGSRQWLPLLGSHFSADHQTCSLRTIIYPGMPLGHRKVPDLCKSRDLCLLKPIHSQGYRSLRNLNAILQWTFMNHGSTTLISKMSFAWWTECGHGRCWEMLNIWGNISFFPCDKTKYWGFAHPKQTEMDCIVSKHNQSGFLIKIITSMLSNYRNITHL